MENHNPLCPWVHHVRAVLRGTLDAGSPLRLLSSEVLQMILNEWERAWPEMLVNIARRWTPEIFIETLISELIKANPNACSGSLSQGLKLNKDGTIKSWTINSRELKNLPELFGAIVTTENLSLHDNQLGSLPNSFGYIQVGGDLTLDTNRLTSLPDSIGGIKVGQNLTLYDNYLTSLPNSIGGIQVGLSLFLHNNKLTSLPDSIGGIQVGQIVTLYDNNLQNAVIPDVFPNVGGSICLSRLDDGSPGQVLEVAWWQ